MPNWEARAMAWGVLPACSRAATARRCSRTVWAEISRITPVSLMVFPRASRQRQPHDVTGGNYVDGLLLDYAIGAFHGTALLRLAAVVSGCRL